MTAMKKSTVVMIFVIIIWCVMRLVFWLYEYPHMEQPGSVSVAGVNRISTAIGFIIEESRTPIEGKILEKCGADLKSALIELIEEEGGDKGAADLLRCGDGWGRPYNVEWRTNLVDVTSPMLIRNRFPLLVWSSGWNGVNEYGNGDDIYY